MSLITAAQHFTKQAADGVAETGMVAYAVDANGSPYVIDERQRLTSPARPAAALARATASGSRQSVASISALEELVQIARSVSLFLHIFFY